VVNRVLMGDSSVNVYVPTPRETELPFAITDSMRGRRVVVTFRVNEKGIPDMGATLIRGLLIESYRPTLIKALSAWRFNPAVAEGCAVPGSADVTISF
jgi:hypothetical protein